jgi:hypothetical protein
MTNVVVRSTRPIGVSVNIPAPSTPITLKNTIQTDINRRLDTLTDVVPDTANTQSGSTLVYDSATDKYVVKILDIDGGTF